MKTSIVNISPPISCLAKFCFLNNWPNCCWPIKLQNSLKYNLFRKKWVIKVNFWHADKYQSFLQVYTIILGFCNQACPKHPQYQVCVFLQYAKNRKNMGHEVDFLLLDRGESFCKLKQVFYKFSVLWVCIASHG